MNVQKYHQHSLIAMGTYCHGNISSLVKLLMNEAKVRSLAEQPSDGKVSAALMNALHARHLQMLILT